ncbi:MAG: LysR family transcriptional regulator [Rhodospirillaceae bacterium]|nr:LysR family transcriptional regulator [Rhodospirillaceae bacterium]
MPLRLPPLNTLRLFEAAGRHKSFKRAAEELHVTPSAVSHGIQTLEDWLGTPLFHRGSRGLSLTPAGSAYLPQVREALTGLAEATARVPGRKATGTLSLSVAPTFALRWLMPRLGAFREAHPGIALTLDTARQYVDFPIDGRDLAIRMARAENAAADWVHLVRESFVPVCSPALAAAVGGAGWPGLLTRVPLIHLTTVSEDWDVWLGAQGLTAPDEGEALYVDTLQAAFEAAVRGLGIALGRRPLVDDEVAQGRLVAVGPDSPGTTSYWLVGLESAFERPEVKAFRQWILSELGTGALRERRT